MSTKRKLFDVDIDVQSSVDRTQYGTPAMIYNEDNERIQPHPSGVYMDEVPVDSITGLCAFDYKYGDEHGFMKVDILHNSTYNIFTSKKDILECLEYDINWDILQDETIVPQLPHIGKHYDIVKKVKPKSIEDLADVLALIRPGKKEHLSDYLKNKERVRRYLYKRPVNGMFFKKSHAISYATMIKVLIKKKFESKIVW